MKFWWNKFLISTVYIILIGVVYKFLSNETSKIIGTFLTTVFVWVMNKTFSIDYQTKNEKELKEYQKKIDKEMEDYKNEWNQKLEDYKNKLDAELETHKAKLSGYTLVTKLQYELEFKIYTESYEMIEKFFVKITRIFNPIIVEESLRIQDEIYQDLEDFYHFKRKYKPFYAPKISQKFSIIAYTINILMYEVNNCVERDRGESLKENLKKLQELKEYKDFQEGCDEIAILIRERIENMKIVE